MTDTSNKITEHTQIKLEVYIIYLKAYLSILGNSQFKHIDIIDIFAGQGKSDNGKEGSALLAFNVIQNYRKEHDKSVRLFLNEKDTQKVNKLKDYIDIEKHPYTHIYNEPANNFISKLKDLNNNHSLIFIDPYGYTSVSGENLNKIFTRRNTDIILFIPVFHIYRFLRKEDNDEQLKPIAQFLQDIGINENDVKDKKIDLDKFCSLILKAIQEKSNSDFCNYYKIKHEKHQSEYALFFCSKHIKGLEEFLRSMKKTDDSHKKEIQLLLPFEEEYQYIINALHSVKTLSNVSLYKLGILSGYYSKEINSHLKNLEDNKRIVVSSATDKTRNKNNFYIGSKYLKDNDERIFVQLR